MMLKSKNKSRCKSEIIKLVDDVPEKDVELCLEVEMDDEVKEIISSPEKYASTLLDVTVIKPRDLDKLCSTQKNTMTRDVVKQLIDAMYMNSKHSSFIPSGDQPRHSDKHKQPSGKSISNQGDAFFEKFKRIYTTDDTNSDDGFLNRRDHQKVRQVYATPKTFNEHIKANFECKKNRKRELNEKLNTPCVCQNCAIVGVVTDSQKKPFATEVMYDPREPPAREEGSRRKRKAEARDNDHAECQYYFKHLSDKIKHLEARIAVQEEKSVPKDYFRRIITKLVTHITKISAYGSQAGLPIKTPSRKSRQEHGPRFAVNPVLIDCKPLQHDLPKPSTSGQAASNNPFLWKWGEEILKPGIDLKNKIILLMEDTLNNLKRTRERTREEEIKSFVHEFSSNLYKTVHEEPERDKPGEHNAGAKPAARKAAPGGETNDKNRKRLCSRFIKKELPEEHVSLEYINSNVLKWQDTETTFKFDSSDVDSIRENMKRKNSDLYRTEFTKTLLNTKNEDKIKLWHSIWNQATANGQSKSDKVTIQLPDKRDPKNKNIEIMYALGDLEKLLIGKKAK